MDARASLALWLRAGRSARGMTLEDVARVTKIQARILERLESGKPEGLPADVFVRGFVRSVAKCVGLDESEALRRFSSCANLPVVVPVVVPGVVGGGAGVSTPPTARAVVQAKGTLAPELAHATPRVLRVPSAPAVASLQEPPGAAPAIEPAMLPTTGLEAAAATISNAGVVADLVAPASVAAIKAAAVATEPAVTSEASAKKKRGRRGGKGRNKRAHSIASGTPSTPLPVVRMEPAACADVTPVTSESRSGDELTVAGASSAGDEIPTAVASITIEAHSTSGAAVASLVEPNVALAASAITPSEPVSEPIERVPAETWQPKMPPLATTTLQWRRPAYVATTVSMPVVPSLVIDDADPESAERELEERTADQDQSIASHRRSFLPPILLDREDRSARQGGLTLAVIILLIAATLTLSYLMRRPSSSGDGVTQLASSPTLVG